MLCGEVQNVYIQLHTLLSGGKSPWYSKGHAKSRNPLFNVCLIIEQGRPCSNAAVVFKDTWRHTTDSHSFFSGLFASEPHRRLRNDLFHNNSEYDTSVRPVINDSVPTIVQMQFFVAQVLDVVSGNRRGRPVVFSCAATDIIYY